MINMLTATCTTCHGKGYYRKDASSYFACDCEDSVTKITDSHSDTDAEWSNPEAHEELARDIERHEGTHPLEGSLLDACPICDDRGYYIVEHPWNHEPIYDRCTCAAGDPETTYRGSVSIPPPLLAYTDADFANVPL